MIFTNYTIEYRCGVLETASTNVTGKCVTEMYLLTKNLLLCYVGQSYFWW